MNIFKNRKGKVQILWRSGRHYEKNYNKIEQRQFKHNIKSSKCSVDDRSERNRLRNLHLMKERIELKDLDVCREKAVKYSLRSLKSLEAL